MTPPDLSRSRGAAGLVPVGQVAFVRAVGVQDAAPVPSSPVAWVVPSSEDVRLWTQAACCAPRQARRDLLAVSRAPFVPPFSLAARGSRVGKCSPSS